jgi:hypothetical protein
MNRRRFLELCGMIALTGCEDRGSAANSVTEFVAAADAPSPSLQGDGFRLSVGQGGAAVVKVGQEPYAIVSRYSYPGERIGTNALALSTKRGREAWQIEIGQSGPDRLQIVAHGQHYTLKRTISVEGHRIGFSDELINRTKEPIGILIRQEIVTTEEPTQLLFAGAPWEQDGLVGSGKSLVKRAMLGLGLLASGVGYSAENPTIFVSQRRSRLGVVVEDTLSRLQFEGQRNRAAFSMGHLALDRNEARTLRWAMYPLTREADYFTFINAVRRDWGTNFTVEGPWDFFDLIDQQEMLGQPGRLKEHLTRKRLRVVAFRPWLDYDNFNWRSGRSVSRSEYKQLMRRGMAAFKTVNPGIKCLGCMQSNLVSLPSEMTQEFYEAIPPEERVQGIHWFTNEQMQLVRELPWKDSLVVGQDGRFIYELYYNGPKRQPLVAIAVHAIPGNAQFAYWMDQAKFILEEIGLDGLYVDQFSLAFRSDPSQRYNYDRWDGVTADIDPTTGRIVRRYTDGAWVGVQAQKKLSEYVHSRSKIMVANTAASSQELQSSSIMRFIEGAEVLNTFAFAEGQEPPTDRHLCRAQLGSPIVLGYRPREPGAPGPEYARRVMEAAITYLKHGLLYYHYGHYGSDHFADGSHPGNYDAITHMFPITPNELGRGFVIGKERIITCVSKTFAWRAMSKPTVLVYDINGLPAETSQSAKKTSNGWEVSLRLRDWRQIAIIEQSLS